MKVIAYDNINKVQGSPEHAGVDDREDEFLFFVACCNRNVLQSYVIAMLEFLIRGFLFGDVITRIFM